MTKVTQILNAPKVDNPIAVGSWWKFRDTLWILTSSLDLEGNICARLVSVDGINWAKDVIVKFSRAIEMAEWNIITGNQPFKRVDSIKIIEE
jgi:hypothetical protein